MNNRYQVRVTAWGEYQIQRSRDGGKFKDLYKLYEGDDSYCYFFLWMAKLVVKNLIWRDGRMVSYSTRTNKIVYGPKPEKKRPSVFKGPSA